MRRIDLGAPLYFKGGRLVHFNGRSATWLARAVPWTALWLASTRTDDVGQACALALALRLGVNP